MSMNNRTQEILEIIKQNHTRKELSVLLDEYHESDIADVLELLSKEERQKLYKSFSIDRLSEIFAYLEDATEYFEEIEIEKEFNPYKLIYEQLKEEYGLYENGLDYAHAKDLNMFIIHFNGKVLLVPDKLEVTCYGYGDIYSHAFQNVLKFGPLTYIEELKTFEDYKKHLDKLIHEYKVSTIQMLSKYN